MPNDPKTLDWTSRTNQNENSCTTAQCDCKTFYELHQQTAIKLLSNHVKDNHYKLEPGYEARARRIAAIYAKTFLETGYYGNSNLVGRFYWMGLGAFASKTMAMVFKANRSVLGYNSSDAIEVVYIGGTLNIRESLNVLAKGNLWLAMDIIPWHLAWAQDKEGFKKCMNSRDFKEFKHLKPAIDSLPWSGSVPKILSFKGKQLGVTTEIDIAFNQHLTKIEEIFNDPKNDTEQLKFENAASYLKKHLMQIAIQEQKNILQKICWSDQALRDNVKAQRGFFTSMVAIDQTLGLSSDIKVGDLKDRRKKEYDVKKLKEDPWSTPPKGTMVENYGSRMAWIKEAAEKYHRLMKNKEGRKFLKKELGVIAGWSGSVFTGKIHPNSNEGKS